MSGNKIIERSSLAPPAPVYLWAITLSDTLESMKCLLAVLVVSAAATCVGRSQVVESSRTQRVISEAGAQQVLKAAEAEAERLHAASAIAVVDESGILVAFLRMDGVRPGSPELAIGKARTAAMLRRPSGETEDNIDNGRYAFITSGFMSLRGGIPILSRGEVIGAVGVAGIDKDQDVRIAQKAADAIKDAIKDALKDQASPPTHP